MYGAPFIDDIAVESTAVTEQPAVQAPTPEAPADQAQQQQAAPTDQPPPTATAPETQPPVVEIPAEIAELREQDALRRTYPPQNTYAMELPETMFDHVAEVSESVRVAAARELREIAADLGLSNTDISNIRGRALHIRERAPNEDEQRQEAAKALRSAFGNVDSALRDVRALVARDPRVGQLINSMGLGNDAQTLVTLTYAARRERMAGRLKWRT